MKIKWKYSSEWRFERPDLFFSLLVKKKEMDIIYDYEDKFRWAVELNFFPGHKSFDELFDSEFKNDDSLDHFANPINLYKHYDCLGKITSITFVSEFKYEFLNTMQDANSIFEFAESLLDWGNHKSENIPIEC